MYPSWIIVLYLLSKEEQANLLIYFICFYLTYLEISDLLDCNTVHHQFFSYLWDMVGSLLSHAVLLMWSCVRLHSVGWTIVQQCLLFKVSGLYSNKRSISQ